MVTNNGRKIGLREEHLQRVQASSESRQENGLETWSQYIYVYIRTIFCFVGWIWSGTSSSMRTVISLGS